MYEYDDEGEGGRSPVRIIVTAVSVLAIAAAGWFLVKPRLSSGDDAEQVTDAPAAAETVASADATTTTTEPDEQVGEDEAVPTTRESTTSTSTTALPSTTEALATTTTTAAAPTTAAPPASAPTNGTYDTLPDGSPVPVVAIFDTSTITLAGAVPDQAAADLLSTLAVANSKTPATVTSYLTINPNVPRTVPVRVIELNSVRFPEGSSEVLLEHGVELNRVVTVMSALPKVSVLVVGHADQRGDDLVNFVISEDRARSVVNYLVGQGVQASRLSSRAVGEADLLSLNDDATALALNRRTEFIFTGLLLG